MSESKFITIRFEVNADMENLHEDLCNALHFSSPGALASLENHVRDIVQVEESTVLGENRYTVHGVPIDLDYSSEIDVRGSGEVEVHTQEGFRIRSTRGYLVRVVKAIDNQE